MCNGLYWVCTHSGNMDDENMNVFVIFLQIIMSLVKVYGTEFVLRSLLREEALPQSLCLCHQAPVAPARWQ